VTDAAAPGPGPEGRDALTPGSTFAGHLIEAVIGRGGMGVVYRARHLALERERALKVVAPKLSADQRFRERFRRESRLAAQVEHPNVIPVHHAGEEGGQLYLAMRLVDGVDLRSLVEAYGPLDPAHAVRVVTGIAAGLDAAHARGLVHRDVKPANVLLEPNGDTERVFLTDFGISRLATSAESLTATGEFFGSVDYVAPEQIEGEPLDRRTDIYALGGILHFMLTAQPPFPRDTELAKLFAHANAPPPRPSEAVRALPPAVDEVVAKAMAKRPEDRYGTAGELALAAAASLGEPTPDLAPAATAPQSPGADTAPTRSLRRASRRRLPLAAGALAAVVAAAVLGVLLLSDGGDSGEEPPAGPQPAVAATIPVEDGPTAITVGAARVWVASTSAHAVDAIDPATDRPVGSPIDVGEQPTSVAVGFGSIWVADLSRDQLIRLDPGESPPTAIGVGDRPTDIAIDDRWVWVTNGGEDDVSRVDPRTDRVDETVQVGAGPRSVAVGEGAVWVANIDGKSVSKIDPQEALTVGPPIELGQRPNDLAVGYGSVWVIDNIDATLTRIDPDTLRVEGDPIRVGSHPRGVKTGFGYVWVANGADGTVTRIDPEAVAQAGAPIRVGKNPADIATGADAVWTANFDSSTVTKVRP
jgi:YVTN family beta-propeller protein